MSFTSQIVRVGEGWDAKAEVNESRDSVYSVYNDGSSAIGPEGSFDDEKELFPDTFVDMAKKANKEIEEEEEEEKRSLFFWRKKKKK